MFIGRTLHFGMDIFTPWFPKPGNNAYFSVQLIAVSSTSVDLEFQVQHKNRDQTGDGDPVGSAVTIDGSSGLPKISAQNATGLKELVRLRYKVTGVSDKQDWAHFVTLNPSPYEDTGT